MATNGYLYLAEKLPAHLNNHNWYTFWDFLHHFH